MIVIGLAAVLAYSPAFTAPFQFDDVGSISANRTIERLWPLALPLRPPPGVAVSGRPVVNVSLAVDYAINRALGVDQRPDPNGRHKTVSYHVTNLLLHLTCGLLLFGVLRRTLRSPALTDDWRASADRIAIVVTIIWLLHPIQTEVVDYVIQRTESIVSVCYLGTLYASIRAWHASNRGRTAGWCVLAVTLCALGMASKEVMITAPLMVILYDRAFGVSSWRMLVERRGGRPWLYALLALTAAISIGFTIRGARSATVGFQLGVTWYEYLYSQAWAILRYLRLVLWPDRLTFDYGRDPIVGLRGIPGVIALSALVVATIVAWRRAPWRGFAGVWFLLLLAPSSSIVPIRTEIAAERRVYLALASVLVMIVAGVEWLRRRATPDGLAQRHRVAVIAFAVGLLYLAVSSAAATKLAESLSDSASLSPPLVWSVRILVGVAAATLLWLFTTGGRRRGVLAVTAMLAAGAFARSQAYADPEALWRGAVSNVPTNARAYDNLAAAILRKDPSRASEAESALRRAIAVDSTYLPAWRNLATVVAEQGRLPEAKTLLERLISIDSTYVDAHERLGSVLVAMGQADRALPYLERVARISPNDENLIALGTAYAALGRSDDATAAFRSALERNPSRTDALVFLGSVLVEAGRAGDALPGLEEAVRRQPDVGYGLAMLSLAYAQVGRARDASAAARTAAQRASGDPAVFVLCGRAMLLAGRAADAEVYLSEAVRLDPRSPEALTRLAMTVVQLGKTGEAEQLLRRALAVQPNYAPAQRGMAALMAGRR